MEKNNILYILPQTVQGGSETQLLHILKNLDRKLFNVHLGVLYHGGELSKEYRNLKNITYVNFNKKGKWDIGIYFKIAKYIKKHNIHIVNSFLGLHNAYIPTLLSKNCIAIGSVRSTFYPQGLFKKCGLSFAKKLSKNNKFYLISNNETALEFYKKYGFIKNSMKMIPNGIQYDVYAKENDMDVKKEFNLKNKLILTMVGRLDARKNHIATIEVIRELHKEYKNIHLLIVGDGPYKQELQKTINNWKLQKHITLTGNRRDIPKILAATNIFLFPTQFPEGWPNAVGEAMSAGLPIVAFPKGDISFIIKHNINGIISSPTTFITDVKKLIDNENLQKKLGKKAQLDAKQYSVHNMVKAYEQCYSKILRRNK